MCCLCLSRAGHNQHGNNPLLNRKETVKRTKSKWRESEIECVPTGKSCVPVCASILLQKHSLSLTFARIGVWKWRTHSRNPLHSLHPFSHSISPHHHLLHFSAVINLCWPVISPWCPLCHSVPVGFGTLSMFASWAHLRLKAQLIKYLCILLPCCCCCRSLIKLICLLFVFVRFHVCLCCYHLCVSASWWCLRTLQLCAKPSGLQSCQARNATEETLGAISFGHLNYGYSSHLHTVNIYAIFSGKSNRFHLYADCILDCQCFLLLAFRCAYWAHLFSMIMYRHLTRHNFFYW